MAKFVIKGRRTIGGEINVSGAKNSALKAFAASLLFENPFRVKNVPQIEDVFRIKELLAKSGVRVSNFGNKSFSLSVPEKIETNLDEKITKRLRASIVLLGPMLARFGKVSLPHPGGCLIGKRPINFFVDGFRAMGAKVHESSNRYFFEAQNLKPADFAFTSPSVTATETLMLASIFSEGKVVLRNCACEPEIGALSSFLNASGAKIKGAGTHTITINGLGRKRLLHSKTPFEVIPDRIEAGSFLILGALLASSRKGGLKIKNCDPTHLSALISQLETAGAKIKTGKNWIWISRPGKLSAANIKTSEYPGFATDLQAPFTVLLTQAEGQSEVFETIFEGRLEYASELSRMGANITICDPHRIIILGPSSLFGCELESPDLRAGLAFIMAGLIAKGKTIIHNIYNIDRGYESVEQKLSSVGADIKRI